MLKLIDIKNAVGNAIAAIEDRKQGKGSSSKLEQSLNEVARMYQSEDGRRYRESLGKATLMANRNDNMLDEYFRTIQCWEIVTNFVKERLYTHPKIVDYTQILYSGLALMELNEEDINAKFAEKR